MLCSTFTNNDNNFLRRRRSIDNKEPESTALVGTDKMEVDTLRDQVSTLKAEIEQVKQAYEEALKELEIFRSGVKVCGNGTAKRHTADPSPPETPPTPPPPPSPATRAVQDVRC
ncbi:PREDICTED: uncharacterized protein LOC106809192 [Priapulus caudatus]|uniref:Uncharacterized protein LOC106809192 n=1 Tax=Priapulus caudatus TaxID=37621 RepID=A0ABM1E652_PRICU|nr:PREDICTED: uncharacterized protein LOC106809192 [Priapulus caudatus]